MASLDVVMEGQLAAHLALPESGWPVLRYRDSYMQASLATPLSTLFVPERVEHSGEPLSNWLLGLLPDDDRVLDSLRERYGTQKSRPLDLLGTPIGADCAGAVQFCTPGQTADLLAGQGGLHHMSDDEVLDCLDEIRRDPAYRPEGYDPGGGFSLAGMQPKIALRRTPEGWALPWGAEPTSHIIKITRSGVYDHEALMEHLTMTTARNLSMRVPQTAVIRRDELEAIVVTRYDRARRGGAPGAHPPGGPVPGVGAAPRLQVPTRRRTVSRGCCGAAEKGRRDGRRGRDGAPAAGHADPAVAGGAQRRSLQELLAAARRRAARPRSAL